MTDRLVRVVLHLPPALVRHAQVVVHDSFAQRPDHPVDARGDEAAALIVAMGELIREAFGSDEFGRVEPAQTRAMREGAECLALGQELADMLDRDPPEQA